MRRRLEQFMQGRYGTDELTKFLMAICLILLLANTFTRQPLLYWLALVLIGYCYFRMFSRNISGRNEENQKYLQNMGTIIYLKGSAATLIKRLEGSNNPTLEGAENKEDKIKKLLKQRDPVYEKFADIKVVTGVKPFDELIAEIEEKLRA